MVVITITQGLNYYDLFNYCFERFHIRNTIFRESLKERNKYSDTRFSLNTVYTKSLFVEVSVHRQSTKVQ